MGRRWRLLPLGAVAAVALGASAWWFLRDPSPPEAEGQAWLSAFADTLTGADTWGARGPAAVLARFSTLKIPGLPGPDQASTEPCVLTWSGRDSSAPVVTYQRLELGRLDGEACGQAQFGMLSVTLRQSDGIGPGQLATLLSDRFGPPDTYRDPGTDGSASYTWQIRKGIFAKMDEPVGRRGGRDFSLLFVRSLGTPAALLTAAEAEAWMDSTVDLVTGPALAAARGPGAARLVGVDMQAQMSDSDGCPSLLSADPVNPGPIGSHQELFLTREDGEACTEARVQSLSMSIWQRDPVTAQAFLQRINPRLGEPTVSREFDMSGVKYAWHTGHGTTVELFEGLHGNMAHNLFLRTFPG